MENNQGATYRRSPTFNTFFEGLFSYSQLQRCCRFPFSFHVISNPLTVIYLISFYFVSAISAIKNEFICSIVMYKRGEKERKEKVRKSFFQCLPYLWFEDLCTSSCYSSSPLFIEKLFGPCTLFFLFKLISQVLTVFHFISSDIRRKVSEWMREREVLSYKSFSSFLFNLFSL